MIGLDGTEAAQAANADDLVKRMYNALKLKSAVVGVTFNNSFYANAFNEPKAVAAQTGALARTAWTQHPGDAPGAYHQWVDAVLHIKVPKGSSGFSSSRVTRTSHKGGMPTWAIVLIVLGVIALIIGIIVAIYFLRSGNRKRKRLLRQIESIEDSLANNLAISSAAANQTVLDFVDAAQRNLASARNAIKEKDFGDAEGYIQKARKAFDEAVRAARQPSTHREEPIRRRYYTEEPTAPVHDEPEPTSSSRSRRVDPNQGMRMQPPGGQPIVINQTTFVPYPAYGSAYPNYYGGGWLGGLYYPSGYYAMPFWEWEILEAEIMLGDRMFYDPTYRVWYDDQFAYAAAQNNFGGYFGGTPWVADSWEGVDASQYWENAGDHGNAFTGTTGGASWGTDNDTFGDAPGYGDGGNDPYSTASSGDNSGGTQYDNQTGSGDFGESPSDSETVGDQDFGGDSGNGGGYTPDPSSYDGGYGGGTPAYDGGDFGGGDTGGGGGDW